MSIPVLKEVQPGLKVKSQLSTSDLIIRWAIHMSSQTCGWRLDCHKTQQEHTHKGSSSVPNRENGLDK